VVYFCAARRLSPAISDSVRTCVAISSWIFIQASVSSCKRKALRATTREAGPRASSRRIERRCPKSAPTGLRRLELALDLDHSLHHREVGVEPLRLLDLLVGLLDGVRRLHVVDEGVVGG